jgi:plasmid stabilization system protein ParE
MKVRFSKLALAELDVILTDLRADNPHAAIRFDDRVQRVFKRIAEFPESAQQIESRPGIRRVPLVRYPYVIHYTIFDGVVTILRIIHAARR